MALAGAALRWRAAAQRSVWLRPVVFVGQRTVDVSEAHEPAVLGDAGFVEEDQVGVVVPAMEPVVPQHSSAVTRTRPTGQAQHHNQKSQPPFA